jgi:hypothetical protein
MTKTLEGWVGLADLLVLKGAVQAALVRLAGGIIRHLHKSFVALAAGIALFGSSLAALASPVTSYQVLVETRADGTAPFEVFLASFATLDDVFAGTTSTPTDFTQIAISPDFQIAGMTWDGSAYRVLVQTRADGTAPFEVFLASFATLDDLFAGTTGALTDFTQIAISPDYQIAGFSSVTTETSPPGSVPEPASLCLILVGLGAARFTMRRR